MKKGFTLIELLVVIAILAILVVFAAPIINDVVNDASLSAKKDSINFYAKEVIRVYLSDNYSTTPSDFNNTADGGVTSDNIITFSNKWINSNIDLSDNSVDCTNSSGDLSKVKFDTVSKTIILENCKINGIGYYSYSNGEVSYTEE